MLLLPLKDLSKDNRGIHLPSEILWRRKEAFSDGVSEKSRSWYQIIAEKVKKQKKK